MISNTVPDTIREFGGVSVDALSATRSIVDETVKSNVASPSTVTAVAHWCMYGALKTSPQVCVVLTQTGPRNGSPEMEYRPAASDGVVRIPIGGRLRTCANVNGHTQTVAP
jgi:hypothetical protein